MVDSVECLAEVHKQGTDRASFIQSLAQSLADDIIVIGPTVTVLENLNDMNVNSAI